jgi:hypothetical protein
VSVRTETLTLAALSVTPAEQRTQDAVYNLKSG